LSADRHRNAELNWLSGFGEILHTRERDIEHFVDCTSVHCDALQSAGQDASHYSLGEGASVARLELGLIVFVSFQLGEKVQTLAGLAHDAQMHFLGWVDWVKGAEDLSLRADAPLESVGHEAHVLRCRQVCEGVPCVQVLSD